MEKVTKQVIEFPTLAEKEENKSTDTISTSDLLKHKRISLPYLFIWICLIVFGFIMMFSASFAESFVNTTHYYQVSDNEAVLQDIPEAVQTQIQADATAYAKRQVIIGIISFGIAFFFAVAVSFKQLLRPRLHNIVYIIVTLLLIYTAARGILDKGAQRWVSIGPIQFQPSELAKVAVVYYLASYFYYRKRERDKEPDARAPWDKKKKSKFRMIQSETYLDFTRPFLRIAVWIILVIIQPHLSGAIILIALAALMFFMGKIPLKSWLRGLVYHVLPLLLVAVIFVLLLFPVFYHMSFPDFVSERFAHSKKRIEMFKDRDLVDADTRRQIEQAEIAFGVGGLTGVGLGRSAQKLNWLAEAHNDFIFPIIGEELGLIGTISVLLLFLLFLFAGFNIAAKASNLAARNMAAGMTFLIVLQAYLNMMVACSLIPATGISLPFFSGGGTANAIFIFAAAVVLCISKSGVKRNPQLVRILDNK